MGIRIVTDSTAEFTLEEARSLEVTVVPLKSIFEDAEYLDGIDLTSDEFYEKLATAKTLPKTSQPSPYEFEQAFRTIQAEGHQIITICLTSSLSGTYQSARQAKELCGGDIWVIDSHTATLGIQILVKRALQLIESGIPAHELVDILEVEKNSICLYAKLDTLEYLYKGGRLSKTSALVGTALNMKPLVSVLEGRLSTAGKCIGTKKAFREVFRLVDQEGGIDYSKPFAIGYTGSRDQFREFEQICKERFGENEPIVGSIGSVIGTHAGPGGAAVVFFRNV